MVLSNRHVEDTVDVFRAAPSASAIKLHIVRTQCVAATVMSFIR